MSSSGIMWRQAYTHQHTHDYCTNATTFTPLARLARARRTHATRNASAHLHIVRTWRSGHLVPHGRAERVGGRRVSCQSTWVQLKPRTYSQPNVRKALASVLARRVAVGECCHDTDDDGVLLRRRRCRRQRPTCTRKLRAGLVRSEVRATQRAADTSARHASARARA